ncbi:CNNM domain-containing protein [Nocardioides lijunqiniae]|uniref:CNNM domain-containing protein n=1 Tax=Nocardioides lijunqiniae TaxID=2760832 RepID=UPI001877FAD4
MSDTAALLVAVLLLVLNAFFVGAEFAIISARRTQIEPRAQAGSRMARTTLRAMENVSLMMAGAQLGITICSLGLGAIGEPAVAHLLEPLFHAVGVPDDFLHPVAFVIALLVVVFLHVVLGEMVPKNIALAGPDRAALVLGPPLVGIVTVLRPLIVGLNWIANTALRLIHVEPRDEVTSTFTREEVAALVEESRGEGLLADEEYDRLSGALGFTEKTVATVVLAPDTLTTVLRGSSPADVEALCATTGFSRFPVADASGELVGYLHIKDVLEPDEERREQPIQDKWIRPFAPVTADDQLQEALETLQRRGAHMARVVDADGTTLGLATLEDVIEELVGEIRDAAHHDAPHDVGTDAPREGVLEAARGDDA